MTAYDSDADGIDIGAGALALNGGTMKSGNVNPTLGLGSHAISTASSHKVGGTTTAPTVNAVTIVSSPASGDTYGAGETIRVRVGFHLPVVVTGRPQLGLTIGYTTGLQPPYPRYPTVRQATYGGGSGTSELTFSYVVVARDADNNGISIGASALGLNNGTIRSWGGANASLGLGSRALGDQGNHKVNGANTRPAVDSVSITSSPASGDTYHAVETIGVQVGFQIPVWVRGSPRLALKIGSSTVQAGYVGGHRTRRLTFHYRVAVPDLDADGISIAADALSTNGGSIRSDASTDATLSLGSHAITNEGDHKVDGPATVAQVTATTISSSPASATTYGAGETISVQLSFQIPVTVTGTPQLELGIGGGTAQADYASGSTTNTLTFEYEVLATDTDTDGISVAATALTLNGGTLRNSAGTNAALGLGTHIVSNATGHKVDGAATVPAVTAVAISSSPASGDTYHAAETIAVQVSFQIAVVVTGTPQLALGMDGGTAQANYASGTGTKTLTFEYAVAASDVDANGISVAATALTLNSGTIQSAANTNATLGLGSHAITNNASHKVNGPATTPAATAVTIASTPASGDTYGAGETIEVQVAFQVAVTVTGAPQLALGIGTETEQAAYANGSGTSTLTFEYVVQPADVDAGGISIGGSALTLNSGTIQSAAGVAATLALTTHAIADDDDHKVNGAVATPPSAAAVEFASQPVSGDTYGAGETIEVRVRFNIVVDVTGTPQLALNIDAATRQATYLSGSGSKSLVFGYVVAATDADSTGVSVAADALTLNSGTLASPFGAAATLSLAGQAITDDGDHKVDGSTATTPTVTGAAIVSAPASGDSYGAGETIEVQVSFNLPVTVSGAPQLALDIGGTTAQAAYASGTGTKTLTFAYQVLATDADANGIEIAANALTLNGGTIQSSAAANATLALGSHAIGAAANHKVDGSATAPTVTSVSIASSPASSDKYGAGETIKVQVVFNIPVTVTGTPQLELAIGAGSAQADYSSGTGSRALTFTYTVLATDLDLNGIGIAAGALTLNSGTIQSAANTNATLGLGSHAITDATGHRVNGAATIPAVSSLAISSTPASGQTYVNNETITVQVGFQIPVTVTGEPQLALMIGSTPRQATYASGTGTKTLAFNYTVQVADADTDGIRVAAGALTLNSGTIQSAANTNANLALGAHALGDDADHKVDGALGPPAVTAVAIGAPPVGDTFQRGEVIEVAVTFNKQVDVTGTPQLALMIGATTRQADYASGTGTASLTFRYTVAMGDADTNGISIRANALTLNDGTILTARGSDAALLGLGTAIVITDSASHKVDGSAFTQLSLQDVSIVSTPLTCGGIPCLHTPDTYGLSERIVVEVEFGRPVLVTGTPQLALSIGLNTRQADYVSGSGTKTLTFAYVVVAEDDDPNGLAIAANALALNSGTVTDARDGTTAVALGLGSHAIADDDDHEVDGSYVRAPAVSDVAILSSPEDGEWYELGEWIEVAVTFTHVVEIMGTPQLALTFHPTVRQAEYRSGSGTHVLRFYYVVQPTDAAGAGLAIAANALTLKDLATAEFDGDPVPTITIVGGATNAALSLGAYAIDDDAAHKVNGALQSTPRVSGVAIASTPITGDTYGAGEEIAASVTFDRHVDVRGTPQLALTLGSGAGRAAYASGSDCRTLSATDGCRTLRFSYVVRRADLDANGLSIAANALTLGSGAIKLFGQLVPPFSATANAALDLGNHAIADAASHKVNGSLGTAPTVSGVTLNTPTVGDTFQRDEVIEVTVTFTEAVQVTGTPQLALGIGSATRKVDYASVTGTTALAFRYTVTTSDTDTDGVSIGAAALTLNGGTIRRSGLALDAELGLGTHAIENSANHKVSGNTFTVASVSNVSITSTPASSSTYSLAERIEVTVTFSRPVTVTGTPQLALTITAQTRQADYAAGSGTNTLTFAYVVASGDTDTNGLAIGTNALALNSGTINDARDNATAATLSHSAVADDANHKVDGSQQTAPAVTAVRITSNPASGDTYGLAERIAVAVTFDRLVDVTGEPRLELTIGTQGEPASYDGTAADGNTLSFRYVVQSSDRDANGIGIGASALALNGGTIKLAGVSTNATLGLGAHAVTASANHKVDGSVAVAPTVSDVAILSDPLTRDDTYGAGEYIVVGVTFDRDVEVRLLDIASLTLNVGTLERGTTHYQLTGGRTLLFRYLVDMFDSDADGISIGANALSSFIGVQIAGGSTNAVLDIGSHAIANAPGHKVDGSLEGAPTVKSVEIVSAPAQGDTYELAEAISVYVVFDRAIVWMGNPQLALEIGAQRRQTGRWWPDPNAHADRLRLARHTVEFRYQVTSSDLDANGIGIPANALTLPNSLLDGIRLDRGRFRSETQAVLDLGTHAISDAGDHKVDGSLETAPVVTGVVLSPRSPGTVERGETIGVGVRFSRPVVLSGTAQLALEIGDHTRQLISQGSNSGYYSLGFSYVVQASDMDADGISIAADALTLVSPSSTLKIDGGTTDANLSLGDHAITNSSYHKVDGSVIPPTPPPRPGVTVSPTRVALHEDPSAGGATNANVGTYTVVLDTQPENEVVIVARSPYAVVTIGADPTPLAKTLTFTMANWNTPQTVTTTAHQDDDARNAWVDVGHSVFGYSVSRAESVGVTVEDDETAAILLDADPSTANMDEAGPLALDELSTSLNNAKSYTVRLSSEPAEDTTITITSNTASVTIGDTDTNTPGNQNTLTFTATNWNTPQTVRLTAAEDDNGVPESATITNAAPTTWYLEYADLTATITANTTDDDTPGFVFDANPSTPAMDDAGPLALDELSSSSTNSASYTVRLSTEPTQTVTATITSADTSSVTVDDTDTDTPSTQNTLTFTSTNWNTPQTVTVTAQQDDNGFNESVTLTHTAATTPNSEYTNVSGGLTASVDDEETPAIALSTSTLSVPEENSATYTVQLATEPVGGNVTVAVTGAADGLSASPTSLTFTSGNWDTARTVTVTAANDQDSDNETATFRHAATGADYGSAAAAEIEATATDNDTPSLHVSPTQLTVDENEDAAYTIRLNTQPSANVTVTVSGASGTVTVDTAQAAGNQNTLTFTSANWATNQTVTVAAADDGNAVNETPILSHTASGGDYASLPSGARPSVRVTVDDDDTAGILLDADPNTPNDQSGPLALNELPSASNNSVDYTVRLSSEPTQDATVTIASNETAVTVDDTDGDSLNGVQNTLTFTSTNWNTPQTVTLTAADDNNGTPESATITHTSATASASEYTNLQATITANTTDDDTPAFVFDADPDTANDQSGPLALEELQSSSTNSDDYTVRLSAQPTQTVTATITSGDTSSVTVDDTDGIAQGTQNTLTFTSSNWNTPQTVTLSAQQDDNGFDETVTITHTAATTPSSEFNNVAGSFTASVTDDETPAIVLSAPTLTVPEENDRTYTVRLATEPVGGSVTVDITGAENRLSASPTRLVFTAGNWDTARTVTVAAANDSDGGNETATFSHAASGADYGSVPAATIVATSTDDDAPSLQVSRTALTVNENSSGTYTIRLNTQPSATVTVTVSGASGAVTVDTSTTTGNQNTLTFTNTNWATAQTVTVSAGDDGNARNEEVNLTHAASGGDYAGLAVGSRPGVTVTVTDNDTAGILLDADPNTPNDQSGPIALAELSTASNNSASYTVRLSSEPTQTATVAIASDDTTAVTVDDTDGDSLNGVQNTLTFTSANWNTPQTVTLTAAQDTDGVGENVTITHTASTATQSEYTNLQATITANTTDAQAPGFVFDADPSSPATDEAGPLQLNELSSSSANSDDYTVRLTSQPTQTVTATITSGNTLAVTVDDTDGIAQGTQNTLTFTSSNWNTPQTVTLSAQQDDNGFDESVTIAHAAATTTNSEYRNVNGSFTATVNDDETPAITLSATALSVQEQNSATYTVRLATEPVGGSVTVDITGAADGLSASPTRLVFTTGSWDTERTVRITAANDLDGDSEMVTFRHAASGADYGSVAANLVATSTDNDTPSLNVTPTQLEVDENNSGTYRVRLNTQPTGNVTVTVSGATGAVTVDTASASGYQNTLTFTNTNWGTNQTVTVAAGDDGNAVNETPTLTHTASGGGYGSLGAGARPSVQLTVDDDDTAGILVDADPDTANDQPGPVQVHELATATNNTHDYTVRLSSEPTQDTTITIASNTPSVTVGDTDGDSLNGVQNTLTFTSANWNTPRTVTLTAAEDDNGVPESATITHTSSTSSSSEYTNLSATLTANTTDDDAPSFVFDADPDAANDQSGPLALNELSSSSTNSDDYTVRLYTQPVQTVTATITSNTPSVTVDDTDGDSANGVQNTLTFTATNWNTPQTVTLTAQQDDNGFDETATLTHSARTTPNSEYTNVNGTFTASVTDDETPAITLSATTLTVPEQDSRTYTVRLATEPVGGAVTVDIAGAADGLSASPTRLFFNSGNWDTARTVRITAANDQNGENETVTFRHAASGADYGSVPAADMVATSTDNDTPRLNVTPTQLEVDENSSGTYRVRLNTQPTANVTVTVSGASGAVTVDTSATTGNQNTLTFSTTTWSAYQTVTVAAGDDGNARNEMLALTHTASGGGYGALAAGARPSVQLTVDDNDTAGILLDADPNTPNDQSGPLALAELSTASNNSVDYTVRLSSEPTQTATVTIASNDTTAVTVDDTDGDSLNGVQNTITFTSANWNTPQTVTLTAAQDTDGVGENVTITHTASTATQSEYTNLQATITANTTDAQAPGFVFDADPSSPATNEAGPLMLAELSSSSTNTDDYTVRLTSQPTQTVTATITSGNTLAVTVDDTDTGNPGTQNTLTFTSSNWNTPQTVTLTAQQDDNGFDESVTITHAAATTTNSEYRNVGGSFMATVNDDETPAITLSTNTLTVPEENSATYTVQLATEPVGGSVTVDITGAANRLSAAPTRLIFTTASWDTARTVRITAANDQDGNNETVTFRHAASGADYGSVTAANLVATSTDNDTPSLNVTPTQLEVDENNSGTYRIRLNTQPTANVTVTVSGATGAVTVDTATTSGDQNTLTFSTTTWSAYQTVTVSAGDDGNAVNEMLTLAHAASGGDYGSLGAGARPSVQLTVDDDDTAGILVDADPNTPNDQSGPLALNELSTATNNSVDYTVRLSSEPTQDATVTIASNTPSVTVGDTDGDSLNGVQNTLTFTSSNWNTPRTVTLTAAEDDNGVPESATITHTSSTSSASEYTNLTATLTANTADDDTPSFVFDADPDAANDQSGPLQLNELSSSSTNSDDYTVRLHTQPVQTVTATITSNTPSVTVDDTDGNSLNGVQNTLTFTSTNWNTPQTVTLTAQQDDNGFDETATITHRARTTPNSEYTNVDGTFTASVNDDETPAITLSRSTLTVPEEDSATYTVRLATEPVGGNATVDITGASLGLSANPTRLVFTTGSWDTERTVRITAANDLDGDNETVTFTHAASGADYGGVPTAALAATSTDNDTPSLQVTPTTLEVDENGSGRYRIRLNTQPSATVTVTVSGTAGAVTVDTATTSGDQNTLTFTTTTWGAHQTVTVSAGDDGNAVNEMLTLTHAASGGDYGSLGAGARPSVQLTVDDDDTAGILVDADPNTPNDQPGPVALNELSTASNNSVSYTVRLSSEPTQDATVTITSNDAAVTVGDTDGDSLNGVQNTLTFTSANWNTPRTVTLTAAEDDNGVGESATVTHATATASQSEYTNLSATLTANTTDDDAPSFVFDADPDTANDQSGPLALDELSSSSTNSDDYTVRLYTQPTRTVTATIASNTPSVTVDTAPASGDQNTLTFTTTNWNTPQTVTLTAQQDDNGFDETATLTHRARTTPNSEYTNVNGTFTASVTDDETPAIILSASTLTVPEENSVTYTVRLDTEPVGGNATVTITGAADGITPNPTRLVFTARNWNTARQVRVTAANDNDSTNEVVTLSHAASGADYGSVPTAAIVVTATDDDTPSLNVSPTRLTVRENRTATYTMRLNTQPSAPVTVTVSGTTAEVTVDADPDATGDQAAMTFDATNWNANRTVTVSAADDDNASDETGEPAARCDGRRLHGPGARLAPRRGGLRGRRRHPGAADRRRPGHGGRPARPAGAERDVRPRGQLEALHRALEDRADGAGGGSRIQRRPRRVRGHRRHAANAHSDLHHDQLGHGADGDRAGGGGRRRLGRARDDLAHGHRRRLRQRLGGTLRDDRGRRRAGHRGGRVVADRLGHRGRNDGGVHGASGHRTGRRGPRIGRDDRPRLRGIWIVTKRASRAGCASTRRTGTRPARHRCAASTTRTPHPAPRCCATRPPAPTTDALRRWTCRSLSRTTMRWKCWRTRRRWM